MRFVTKEDDQPEYRPAYLRTSLVTETVGKYSYSSRHASNSKPIPPSTPILGSNVAPSVNQFDFEMFVENKSKERYHTYTCIQSDIGSTSRALHDVANWRDSYPRLASDYLDNRSDGELILVESNLDLLRDYPPSGSKLGNHSSIQINRGAKYSEWQSRTFLYEHGVQVTGERNNIDWDDQPVPLDAVDIDSTNATKIVLRLSCSWWASNVFSKILNDARRAQSQGDAYAIQQAEEAGRQFLEGMSMMQEISAWPGRDTNSPQTIAILLWKFRQTRNQEAATTTWRKLTLPCVRDAMSISAQFSGPTTLQSSLSIDTSLQDMLAVQQAPIYTDLSRHNSLFVDDPESIITGQPSDIDSTLSTPTPDMRSLPSSTATSLLRPTLDACIYHITRQNLL